MPDPSDNFKVNLNQNLWGFGRWPRGIRRSGALPPVQAGLVRVVYLRVDEPFPSCYDNRLHDPLLPRTIEPLTPFFGEGDMSNNHFNPLLTR